MDRISDYYLNNILMSLINETPLLASTLIDPYIRVNAAIDPCLNHLTKLASEANRKYGKYMYRMDKHYYIDLFNAMDINGTVKSLKLKHTHEHDKTFTVQFNDRPYCFFAVDDKNHIKLSVSTIPAREVRVATIALLDAGQGHILHTHSNWCKQILKTKEISFEAYTIARNLINTIQLFRISKISDVPTNPIGVVMTRLYKRCKIPLPIPLKEKLINIVINEAKYITHELIIVALYIH